MAQDSGGNLILSPETLGDKILDWKKRGYHVLSPAIQVSNFAPGYGVNASLVVLDPAIDTDDGDIGSGDVYYDRATMDDDERAPSKIGLMKIAAAAGVSWVKGERVDPLTIQNLWIYRVLGVYLAYDGTPQTIPGEKEIDYRDGSAQIGEWSREAQAAMDQRNRTLPQGSKAEYAINGWSEKRVRQARCNGAERAETGALTRAIRTLGVKHTYKVAELKFPFVALRVCPVVNMQDPEVARMVTERQLSGVAALYAVPTSRPALPPAYVPERVQEAVVVRQPEPAPVRAATPDPPPAPAVRQSQSQRQREPGDDDAEAAASGNADGNLAQGTVTIVDIKKRKKPYGANHAKAGQEFTIWEVTDSTSQVSTTAFARWGQKAEAAWKAKPPTPVILVVAQNRFNETEIQNIKLASEVTAKAPAVLEGARL